MLFPTFTFTVFFLVVLAVWWGVLTEHTSAAVRRAVLAAASLVFYAWADARWAGALVLMATATWACSGWLARAPAPNFRRRRGWASVSVLIAALVVWKYLPWLVLERNGWAEAWGWKPWLLPEWAYPAGLSFFTFHALGLVLSVWHRRTAPLSWGGTLAHVSFFPTLLAGPVLRADATAPRLAQPFCWQDVPWLEGIARVMVGMTFKWVFASQAAQWADPVFQGLATTRLDVWWGVHAYAAQIFFDFAGYSYMALGVAVMLGFQLPENFTQPYRATSVQDFWRRWHRSLSGFFRDHLYIDALGGNRHGKARALGAAAFTMIVSGLWHGASALFLVWGVWHAIGLVIERLCPGRSRWPAWLGWLTTFQFVVWGWVWFRSDSVETAVELFGQAWGADGAFGGADPWAPATVAWAAAMALAVASEHRWWPALVTWCQRTDRPAADLWRSILSIGILGVWAWTIIALGPVGVPAFIYNGF